MQQSYTPTPSVASSCPKPGASGTGREQEKHADDGWTRRTTIPRILTAPCLPNEAASPPQKNDEPADHDILHPVFAAIQRQLDQNVWWAHRAWGRTRCDCGRRAASGEGQGQLRRAGVENDDTTRGSSELGEKSRHLARRHRPVWRQTSALMRGTLRDNNDPVSYLVFSPTKPSVIAAYMEEYSRLPRHMSAPDIKDLPDTTMLLIESAHWLFHGPSFSNLRQVHGNLLDHVDHLRKNVSAAILSPFRKINVSVNTCACRDYFLIRRPTQEPLGAGRYHAVVN